MSRWITLRTFTYPHEAYVAKSMLEGEGIPVFMKDELMAGIGNIYSQVVGGVKLQVPEEEIEDAVKILKDGGYMDE